MVTKEGLAEVNEKLGGIDIGKGGKAKKYVLVSDRVKAFRDLCPDGCIETQIISIEDGVVTMKATIYDEGGKVISTGMAQEKEVSSFINKTSYIENCETSAVGRALGFAGIGIDASMASAEEVANAMMQQDALSSKISEKEVKILERMCERKGFDVGTTFPDGVENLTGEQYAKAAKKLGALPDKEIA